jgi:nucleotide-binding universal stress UspA family protein
MSCRRIHFLISAHGSPTSLATIDYACAVAKKMSATLDVTLPQVDVKVPSSWFAGKMMAGIAQDVENTISEKRDELEAYLKQRCDAESVGLRTANAHLDWPAGPSSLVALGRTSDLCLLGLPRTALAEVGEVEPWLFATGRPCLLHPDTAAGVFPLDTVAVAWDMSRSAARAVGDSLSLLKCAKAVRILVGRGEKTMASANPAASLIDYLAAHEINATVDEFDASRQKIGEGILARAGAHNADLLVMGAFGHSRLREFVLGGATRHVIDASPIPLFMSH